VTVQLTAQLIENFAGAFLSSRYDDPKPTPPMHRECWELYASAAPAVCVIAPRDHAKSTALTYDYILAEVMFRTSDYVILIGSTEEKAGEQLSNISEELHDNEELRKEFGVKQFEVDSRTEIIVKMRDGHRFRILARGAEQRIRGTMWKGKRPNLIVCDDLEDDEQVENVERRRKFRKWFFRAAKQALSKRGKIRVHGTILHEDSLLNRMRKMSTWKHLFYKAHESFDDFSNRLWDARWSEEQLRARRQEFIDDHDAAGSAQEFLNDPMDSSDAYLTKEGFIPMNEVDHATPKLLCASADFAVSKADKANRTAFMVGGKCSRNLLHYIHFEAGRLSPSVTEQERRDGEFGWIDRMFEIQVTFQPEIFWVEDGVIWKAVRQMVYEEMTKRDVFINIEAIPSITDKATRGRSLQKRHRAGATRWNTAADGYEDARMELLRFTGTSQATLDDQFDAAATLSLGFDRLALVEEGDFQDEEEMEFDRQAAEYESHSASVTGY
jgi:hypothetical protein